MFDLVIFDVDGTLFQTEKVALPAFYETFDQLKEKGLYDSPRPSDDKLLSVFGMTIPELWETLLPDASMDVRDQANELFAKNEMAQMEAGRGELYPSVKNTLQQLYDRGVKIMTASNGEQRYVKAVIETQKLTPLFTKLYSAGEYKTEKKEELVARILQDFPNQSACMVGDRQSDIAAGRANKLPTVGCDFGFAKSGELAHADCVIDHFDQLIGCLEQLAK